MDNLIDDDLKIWQANIFQSEELDRYVGVHSLCNKICVCLLCGDSSRSVIETAMAEDFLTFFFYGVNVFGESTGREREKLTIRLNFLIKCVDSPCIRTRIFF